jgi:hypothetical protein
MIDPGRVHQAREFADAATTEAHIAASQSSPLCVMQFQDPAVAREAYATGISDLLRYMCGDTDLPDALKAINERYLGPD